jgi:membrane complex biogenesis BtpA family protein
MDPGSVMAELFGAPRALIGVVHLSALPGTPYGGLAVAEIAARAVAGACAYHAAGFDAVILENMHDRPYLKGAVGPEIVAAMTLAGCEVRRAVPLPLGVQVLAAANREALAVAHAIGAAFVRVEGFVFAHVADEGVIESGAGALLRYRKAIGAEGVRVFADIKKKHSAHAITADVDLAETARAAAFFGADGVIVTGVATGRETRPGDVAAARAAVEIPVLVGSGITAENLARYDAADGLIVGSGAKRGGSWSAPVDEDRARQLARNFKIRNSSL